MAAYKASMEKKLRQSNEVLERALNEVKTLGGLLLICACCKKIRDTEDYWHSLEKYLSEHADVSCTHSICPDCIEKYYK